MSFANAWGSSFGSSSTSIIKNVFVDYGSVELSSDSEIIAINLNDDVECLLDTEVFVVEINENDNSIYMEDNQDTFIEVDDVDLQ